MSQLTRCNAGCNKNFYIDDFKEEQLSGGVEKTYFVCPNCEYQYIAFYTDKRVRNLQERLRGLRKRFRDQREDIEKLTERESELTRQIKSRMTILKNKYSKHS